MKFFKQLFCKHNYIPIEFMGMTTIRHHHFNQSAELWLHQCSHCQHQTPMPTENHFPLIQPPRGRGVPKNYDLPLKELLRWYETNKQIEKELVNKQLNNEAINQSHLKQIRRENATLDMVIRYKEEPNIKKL